MSVLFFLLLVPFLAIIVDNEFLPNQNLMVRHIGDARSLVTKVDGPISLVLTDPSWGHNYQSKEVKSLTLKAFTLSTENDIMSTVGNLQT